MISEQGRLSESGSCLPRSCRTNRFSRFAQRPFRESRAICVYRAPPAVVGLAGTPPNSSVGPSPVAQSAPPGGQSGGGAEGLRPPHWPVRAFTVTECAARAFLSVMPTALGDKSPRWAVTGRVRPDAARMRWQGHRMEERTSSGVPSQGAHPSRPQTPPPTSTPPRTPTPLFVVAGTAKALTSACCGGGWGVRWCPSGRRQFLAPRHGTARSRLLPAVGAGRVEHTPRLRLERALVARDVARPCTRPPNGCRAHAAHGARGGPSAPSPPHAAPLPIQPSPSSPFPPAPHPIHPPLPARAGWPTPRRPVFFFFASCSLVGVRGGEEGGRGAGGWWVAACCGGGGGRARSGHCVTLVDAAH